jgi:hypothetical protein
MENTVYSLGDLSENTVYSLGDLSENTVYSLGDLSEMIKSIEQPEVRVKNMQLYHKKMTKTVNGICNMLCHMEEKDTYLGHLNKALFMALETESKPIKEYMTSLKMVYDLETVIVASIDVAIDDKCKEDFGEPAEHIALSLRSNYYLETMADELKWVVSDAVLIQKIYSNIRDNMNMPTDEYFDRFGRFKTNEMKHWISEFSDTVKEHYQELIERSQNPKEATGEQEVMSKWFFDSTKDT